MDRTIRFDEVTHTYFLGDSPLVSVTQLMQLMGVAPNYTDVPKEVLEKAAEYGTHIHKELETYNKAAINNHRLYPWCDFIIAYNNEIDKLGYNPMFSEHIVYNDIIAGTVDCIFEDKDHKLVLCDYKTTSSLNKDCVAWQLSLYKFLWDNSHDQKIDRIELWHFDKNNNNALSVYPLTLKPQEEVDSLITAYCLGTPYFETPAIVDKQLLCDLTTAEQIIQLCEREMKKAKKNAEEIKSHIIASMKSKSVHKFENDKMIITLVDESTRTTFDTSRFKSEQPLMYEDYLKTSKVAASVRIKLKEEE